MKRWVILGAAEIKDYSVIKKLLNKDDFIVCADGGQRHLEFLEVASDLFLGDYDSSVKPETTAETIVYPVEKDDTDTLVAVKEGIKRGCRDFLILGGTGGRMDHTFANIQTLIFACENGAKAVLADEKNTAFVIKNSSVEVEKEQNEKVSVFSFDNKAQGVTLEGFHYPLNNADIKSSFPIGVSNYVENTTGRITVSNGTLLIIKSKE